MAKQMISKSINIKVVGVLDKNEDGKYIISIEGKDNVQEYSLNEILDQCLGTEISLTSVDEMI